MFLGRSPALMLPYFLHSSAANLTFSIHWQRDQDLLQYYSVLQRTTPVLLCTTQYYSSTTPYYKILVQYYSVLQSPTPVLLCTTKSYSSTTKYYSSPTPVLLRTTKYYSSTTPYYKILLQYSSTKKASPNSNLQTFHANPVGIFNLQ